MKTFNFEANGMDFGNYSGETLKDACEAFAGYAGYTSWTAMVKQAVETAGANNVEVREVLNNGQIGPVEEINN